MADEFPTDFDVIVIGTGLPESILAAAFSRIGQKVLHIDRNGYYSGRWCSFNLQGVDNWLEQIEGKDALQKPDSSTINNLVSSEENVIELELVDTSYSHTNIKFYIGDEDETFDEKLATDSSSEKQCQNTAKSDKEGEIHSQEKDIKSENSEVKPVDNPGDLVKENEDECAEISESDSKKLETKDDDVQKSKVQTISENKGESSLQEDSSQNKEKWAKNRLKKEWRKYNLDLTPKLLYCGGSMVQLLITSDIAKYCEFKTVTRMLTLLDGKLERVPCSRADVFNSKEVSMLEKRMLMKFLTSCANYDKNPDYEAFTDKPFTEYLESKKLTKNIKHFVQYSIAMATEQTLTVEGLARTKKFLHSLGRYGNTAFLWPLYGCGELPQSFCRMCAVFGGVYCLKMSASHLIVDKNKQCTGVISNDGKKISAKYVIIEESSVPTSLFQPSNKRYLSRAVLVTDKSILEDDSQQLSLLEIPDKNGRCLTTVIELPPSSMSSPSPLYVVHVTKESDEWETTPEKDLEEIIRTLFQSDSSESIDSSKPVIMWSLYFKREFYSDVSVDRNIVPDNVIVIPGPGPQIDLDNVVDETKEIFEKLMPGEDFLPRPPNPEDIIYVDDTENTVPENSNQSDFTNDKTEQSELDNSNQLESVNQETDDFSQSNQEHSVTDQSDTSKAGTD